jgi:peptidoglycan-associated lipoprotein
MTLPSARGECRRHDGSAAEDRARGGLRHQFRHRQATDIVETKAMEQKLQQVLALLTGNPQLRIAIEGHTDNAGAPPFNNQRLSKDCAGAVKFWLVAHGVDAGRLEAPGFGDTRPVADNASEDGRAKNRRVELVRQ